MKRAIVVAVRENVDKKTGENNLWVTSAIMPGKMSNGGLYYPKSTDILVNSCFGEVRHPDKFAAYKKLKIGTLVDIEYGFNEITQKPFVRKLHEVAPTPFEETDLYV